MLAQVITHTSQCHPEGSATYPTGDTITFRYHPDRDPALADHLFTAPPCTEIRYRAETTGKPPLTHTWTVPGTPFRATGNPTVFDTARLPSGLHGLTLTVANAHGRARHTSLLWIPTLTPPLPAPTADETPSPDLEIDLTARAPGAAQWRWSFGDGTGTPWTSHPCHLDTARTTHHYTRPGTYRVTAHARNCRNGTHTTPSLTVTVGDPNAITLTGFRALGCTDAFCVFDTNQPVHFALDTTATPDRYHWDWDGDGTIDQTTTEPVSHAYPDFGVYTPTVTVERGDGSDTLTLDTWILIS